ncbi:MAG: protein kinase [Blastocatellia bacterium]
MISPEQHQRLTELLDEALKYSSAERESFLARACAGDDSLRCEVESLIAALDDSPDFIEAPALDQFSELLADDQPMEGRRIGHYRIVREIGRGGMGAVYLAERADEYREKVALKLVKRGMDTEFVVRRFRHERQILASLNHPNIARLLDGGTTEDGLPYFVMEYIEGEPISEYCDHHHLSISERLKLFRTVCAAVHYAHQNLVIHRDLKPGNILITADGAVKLLDFGIAKILNPEISQTVEKTATLMRLMTPEYASPEQVRGEQVTTASDVYSLGVILYELLTGHRPYRITSILPSDIERIICEQEPEPPSRRLMTDGRWQMRDGSGQRMRGLLMRLLPPAALRLLTTDHRLPNPDYRIPTSALRGDLDNIVLMALRKEPQRRYASVNGLSEDIRRHLEGQPVTARGDTFGYRAGKFIQRHKAGVAAAALIVLSLIAGLIATIWQARRATAAQARAERRFNDVRKLANSYLFEFHDRIIDLNGTLPARQLLVQRGLEYLDSLSHEASNDPVLQTELGQAYTKLGDLQGHPAFRNLGDYAGAVSSYQKGLALFEAAQAEHPENLKYRSMVAKAHERIGDMLLRNSDTKGAGERFRLALKMREELYAAEPKNQQFFRELSVSYDRVGYFLLEVKDAAGALESFRKGMQMGEAQVAAEPGNPDAQRDLAVGWQNLGKALGLAGRWSEALENYRHALAISQTLSKSKPENAEYRRDCQIYLRKVGEAQTEIKDFTSAIESYQQSLKIAQEQVVTNSSDNESRLDLALILTRLGETWAKLAENRHHKTDWQQARTWFSRGLAEWQDIKKHNALPAENDEYLESLPREIAKCEAALKQ